jgi:hypothetical protein
LGPLAPNDRFEVTTMDDFRVGGMPTLPLDVGFSPEDKARTTGSAPTRRTGVSGGLSNAAMTDHVGGNDPAGPNVGDWLDAPGPGQEIDMTGLMVTLHQAAVTLRSAVHEAQQVARKAQEVDMRAEAQDIRNSAEFGFGAALAAGLGQIAGGALDIGGAAAAGRAAFPEGTEESKVSTQSEDELKGVSEELNTDAKTSKATDASETDALQEQENNLEENAPKSNGEPDEATAEQSLKKALDKAKKKKLQQQEVRNFKRADIILKRTAGMSQATVGLGQVISAGVELQSKQQDAAEKEDEADATKAAAQVEDVDNLLKNIDDLISGVRQVFGQMIEAKNESMNKITQA